MKSGYVSVLPFLLLGCRDDAQTVGSPVDAGSDRDAAVLIDGGNPATTDASTSSSDDSLPNDNLTIDIDDSADELTIVGQWSTDVASNASNRDASTDETTTPDESTTPDATAPASSSSAVGSEVVSSASTSEPESDAVTSVETDDLTVVVTPDIDAAVTMLESGTIDTADAAITSSTTTDPDAGSLDTDVSVSSETTARDDAGAPSLRLEGCTRVLGERPATTPTASAPQVAGLGIGVGIAGQSLTGSVQFQDAENDATTLIVQLASANEHYLCSLSTADLQGGSVNLSVLALSSAFPEGGHTLYVGVADGAGNVSGYLAGSLTVGTNSAQTVCGQAPRLLIGAVPSQSTTFYEQQNGTSPDYDAGSPLAIVATTDLYLRLDACTELLVSGDAAGQNALGWDNCLLVEYRPSPEAPREAVWSYCSLPVFETATGAQVPMADEAPTVAGNALYPPVPNSAAFGWPARSLDLMRYVPENHPSEFVLNLRLLDFGSYGSTTDVWLSAEGSTTAFD